MPERSEVRSFDEQNWGFSVSAVIMGRLPQESATHGALWRMVARILRACSAAEG